MNWETFNELGPTGYMVGLVFIYVLLISIVSIFSTPRKLRSDFSVREAGQDSMPVAPKPSRIKHKLVVPGMPDVVESGLVKSLDITSDTSESDNTPDLTFRSTDLSLGNKIGIFILLVASISVIGILLNAPSFPSSNDDGTKLPSVDLDSSHKRSGSESNYAKSVYPKTAEKIKPLELGEAILLFMPENSSKSVNWDFRENAAIVWNTEGYEAENMGSNETLSFRDGLMRIEVLGKKSHVLKKNKYELAWTVRYSSHANPRFGIETISLSPGILHTNEYCFGTLYDGCSFELYPSLKKIGISATQVCKTSKSQPHIVGYELSYSGKSTTYVRIEDDFGSGGQTSSVVLFFKKPSNLCGEGEYAADQLNYDKQNPLDQTTKYEFKASFDCFKAKSQAELLICSDAELAQLDIELATLYEKAKNLTNDQDEFRRVNKMEWLRREKTCSDRTCLFDWYSRRHEQLMQLVETN